MPTSPTKKSELPPARPPRSRPVSVQLSGSASSSTFTSSNHGSPAPTLRPRPPSSRSRRSSWAPTARSSDDSARASPVPSNRFGESSSGDPQDGGSLGSFMDVVEERTEDNLQKSSKEALQHALRREWAEREKLLARLEEVDAAQRASERRAVELEARNKAVQEKLDSAYADEEHLESDLEAAHELVDLLRSNLAESEKQCRLAARRYADQEKAFEAERTVHQADQQHLIQRIKSLTTERIASPGGTQSEAQIALQEELTTLTASHQTLVSQLTTLANELHEVKSDNARLSEENSSWQLLIEERTLAGSVRGGLISGGSERPDREFGASPTSSAGRREPSALDTLEEQMEMDELHGELDAHHDVYREIDQARRQAMSPGSNIVELASPTLPSRASFATEVGVDLSRELESLRDDNKTLKEANKALTLYCSKILDRILAQEGYEHVLSLDYRTRRGTRSASSKKSRPSVGEIAKQMEEEGPLPQRRLSSSASDAVAGQGPAIPSRRARPVSMYAPAPSTTMPQVEKKSDTDSKKNRFSIDFRALGFGVAEKPEAKPQLKPLRLASRASVTSPSPPNPNASLSLTPPLPSRSLSDSPSALCPETAIPRRGSASISPIPGARKLEPQEEDEEDRRARSHMEAQLKLLGLAAAEPPAPAPAPAPKPSGPAAWLKSLRPSSSTSTATVTDRNGPTAAPPTTEAEAALRAYDATQREDARLLEKGKGSERDSYTTSPRISRRRRSSVPQVSAVGVEANGGASDEVKGHRTRESGSTLWSLGSTQE